MQRGLSLNSVEKQFLTLGFRLVETSQWLRTYEREDSTGKVTGFYDPRTREVDLCYNNTSLETITTTDTSPLEAHLKLQQARGLEKPDSNDAHSFNLRAARQYLSRTEPTVIPLVRGFFNNLREY